MSILTHSSRQRRIGGFTLIELLVGLTVGAIVLIGVIFSWALAVRNNAYVLSVAALNNDMRSLTHIIAQDVRRATEHPNTGQQVPGIVEVGDSCIAFWAGFLDDDDPNNFDVLVRSGYRLDADGSLQIWSPDSAQTPRCDPDSPQFQNAGNWEVLLAAGDRGISLAELNFPVGGSVCLNLDGGDDTFDRCPSGATNSLELLLVQIELTGRMEIAGAERLLRIQDQVKVRNELLL